MPVSVENPFPVYEAGDYTRVSFLLPKEDVLSQGCLGHKGDTCFPVTYRIRFPKRDEFETWCCTEARKIVERVTTPWEELDLAQILVRDAVRAVVRKPDRTDSWDPLKEERVSFVR